MPCVLRYLAFTSLLPLATACADPSSNGSGPDATETGTTETGTTETGNGDGDGDGDGDEVIPDAQYLEITLQFPTGSSSQVRSIGVLDVTEPGSPAGSAMILEVSLGEIQRYSSADATWSAYLVGSYDLYVHDFVHDPLAPAVPVEGLPSLLLRPSFAPDGSGLAVRAGDDFPDPNQIYYVPLSSDGPGTPALVHEGSEALSIPSISPNGQLLFFTDAVADTTQLYASEVGSGAPSEPVQLTDLPLGTIDMEGGRVVDGAVFFSFNDGSTQLMRLDVADWPAFEVSPVHPPNLAPYQQWKISNDGTRVLHSYSESNSGTAFLELIMTDGDVIGEPLLFERQLDTNSVNYGFSPNGRFASYAAFDDTLAQSDVLVSDLDGPSPGDPILLGVSSSWHLITDRWIAWPAPGGTLMAANLDDGIGTPMALTNAGSCDVVWPLEDQRLFYQAPDESYWVVDLSGDIPAAPQRLTQPVDPSVWVIRTWLLPSMLDDRAFYGLRIGTYAEDSRREIWVNDANDDAPLKVVEWPNMLNARLYSPGRRFIAGTAF